jgi:hypothetical protein
VTPAEQTKTGIPVQAPASQNTAAEQAIVAPSAYPPDVASASGLAAATVRDFYAAFNRGDVDALTNLFAEDCVYYDAVYLEPKFGRAAVTAYFEKFKEGVDADSLFFTVSELAGDDKSCGVAWYVLCSSLVFMVFARDSVTLLSNPTAKLTNSSVDFRYSPIFALL